MSIWARSGSLWLDVFRLACHGLTLALLMSFLGDYVPVGDSLAVFRIEMAVLLAVLGCVALVLGRGFIAMSAAFMVLVTGFSILPFLVRDTGEDPVDFVLHQHNVLFRNSDLDAFAATMIESRADVLTLQEIGSLNMRLEDLLTPAFPHHMICRYDTRGVAVFARDLGPVLARGCGRDEPMAWVRIDTRQGPVTFASIHLSWPWPIVKNQFWQVEPLVQGIKNLLQPVVIGGDFNITPWASSIRRLATAAGGRVAGGLRPTYVLGFGWPAFRIDNVIRPIGGAAHVSRSPRYGSDHYGLTADISLGD